MRGRRREGAAAPEKGQRPRENRDEMGDVILLHHTQGIRPYALCVVRERYRSWPRKTVLRADKGGLGCSKSGLRSASQARRYVAVLRALPNFRREGGKALLLGFLTNRPDS